MNLRKSISMHGLVLNIAGALLVLAGIGLVAMTARGLLNYRAAAGRHGGESPANGAAEAGAFQHRALFPGSNAARKGPRRLYPATG